MISIDPSWRGTGGAAFHSGHLIDVCLVRSNQKLTWATMNRLAIDMRTAFHEAVLEKVEDVEVLRHWVIEVPKIYPHNTKRSADGTDHNVDPNDIVRLAYLAGVLAPGAETVTPQEWKKQVPKKIHNQRVLSRLNEKERYLIEDYNCPAHLKHNVIDAVGLGLWKLGRM